MLFYLIRRAATELIEYFGFVCLAVTAGCQLGTSLDGYTQPADSTAADVFELSDTLDANPDVLVSPDTSPGQVTCADLLLAQASPECLDCFSTRCSTVCSAIFAAPAFAPVAQCLSNCNNQNCRDNCMELTSIGKAVRGTLVTSGYSCGVQQCKTECYSSGIELPTCKGIFLNPGPCETCREDKCAEQCEACLANADCRHYIACTDACDSNTECLLFCDLTFRDGVQLYLNFGGDGPNTCTTACSHACQGTCGAHFADEQCEACKKQHCENTCLVCEANAECYMLMRCVGQCNDTACLTRCKGNFSQEATKMLDDFVGSNGCIATHCHSQCASN